MKVKLPRNKFLKWLIILIATYILIFILIKLINTNSKNCETDDDCIYYNLACNSCEKIAINKNYELTKNIEHVIKCGSTIPYYLLKYTLTGWHIDCIEIYLNDVYCNEEKKCEYNRIDCEIICENLEEYNIKKYQSEYSQYVINSCNCQSENI